MTHTIKIPEKVDFLESMSSSYNYDPDYIKKDKYWIRAREDYEKYFINGDHKTSRYRIPPKIHQIWMGSELPAKYAKWTESWKKYHPDWEYYLWTDEEISKLKFQNRDVFYGTKNFGPKSDILRYELLNQFGGLYIDTDFECFQPFDFLHVNMDFYAGIEFGRELTTTTSIIASVPGHPIVKYLLNAIDKPVTTDDTDIIHEITGPWAFSNAYRAYMFDDNYRQVLMPVSYFFPFPNNKIHIQNEKNILKFRKKESMALHYWEVSWLGKKSFVGRMISKILRSVPPGIKGKIKSILGK